MLAGELALAKVDVAIVERRSTPELVGSRAGGFHSRTLEIGPARYHRPIPCRGTRRGSGWESFRDAVADGAGWLQAVYARAAWTCILEVTAR